MNERVAKKNLSAEMYAEVDALPENERRRLMWVVSVTSLLNSILDVSADEFSLLLDSMFESGEGKS